MTTGLFDRSSIAMPPTRTGIMPIGSGRPRGRPRLRSWRRRRLLLVAPLAGAVVVLERRSRLLHVFQHPLRRRSELRVAVRLDELLEFLARGVVLVQLLREGEAYHEARLNRYGVGRKLLHELPIEFDALERRGRGLGFLEHVRRGLVRRERDPDGIVEDGDVVELLQRVRERVAVGLAPLLLE